MPAVDAARVHGPAGDAVLLRGGEHRRARPALPVPPNVPGHGGQAAERALAPGTVLGPPLLLQDAPALGYLLSGPVVLPRSCHSANLNHALAGREQRARRRLHAGSAPAHAVLPPARRGDRPRHLLVPPHRLVAWPVRRRSPAPARPFVARQQWL